jgi:hypothetical protein
MNQTINNMLVIQKQYRIQFLSTKYIFEEIENGKTKNLVSVIIEDMYLNKFKEFINDKHYEGILKLK